MMKNIKLALSLLVVVALAFSLSACGNGDQSSDKQTVVGTLVQIEPENLDIRTVDGEDYSFSIVGAELDLQNGIEKGNWIAIEFEGELDGTDTSKVTVTRVIDKDENVNAEKEKVTMSDETEKLYATNEVNVRDSYSTSANIIGTLKQAQEVNVSAKSSNGWYRIDFEGKEGYVFGDYLSTQKPKITSQKEQTVEGTITKVHTSQTKSLIALEVKNKSYIINTGDGNKESLKAGDVVKITYVGDLAHNPKVIEVLLVQ